MKKDDTPAKVATTMTSSPFTWTPSAGKPAPSPATFESAHRR
jgi:hypothetical protein